MDLIYTKDVDKSLLTQGFTIRHSLLSQLLGKVSPLGIGESRPISIILNNKIYSNIVLINQNFNRDKYPDHPEMYQVRYTETSDFSKALRATFPQLAEYIKTQQRIKIEQQSRKNIRIPDEMHCSVAFYETTSPDVWEAVPYYSNDYNEAMHTLKQYSTDEANYENSLLRDEEAHIETEQRWVKVRKLDRNVCLNLKRLYEYRCQICGELITAPYTNGNEKVIEAHHIIPFTESCNNNFDNVMILCPNHHRIVHTCHPVFRTRALEFVYPNGYHEKLKLNKHL